MMDKNRPLENLYAQIPGRKQQVKLFAKLFGLEHHYVVPSFFVYGHAATGKSLVLTSLFEFLHLPFVFVNCEECYTAFLLYERILNELATPQTASSLEPQPYVKCDNLNDFVHKLRATVQKRHPSQTLYIVLKKAEFLRDMHLNILPAFLKLQDLTQLNISVIFISEIVWEKFQCGTMLIQPFTIHFPDYGKDELLDIMALDCPSDYEKDFYRSYCSLLLSVFYTVCRSLNELRHLALINFPKYVDPVKRGEASLGSTNKLWRNVEPHLKKALSTVYLREVSSREWEKMQQENSEPCSFPTVQHSTQALASRSNMELPFFSKYLLIAAYLASYNPATTDKRFFTKGSAKVGKRAQLASMKRNERKSNQILGPKPFLMDRLMAIFYAIVNGKVAPTANIFSQISSLVTLGLLAQIASVDRLDTPKYKCLVSLEFTKVIARTINFDVVRHLYDFII